MWSISGTAPAVYSPGQIKECHKVSLSGQLAYKPRFKLDTI